ncbi:efflux RND transporter permease subunit [Phenylobacterium sp.]|uniref:efflux RND transporter permease subunit n=1 Tax=Phenylobacterium sp. TaxID=1871053 RepID=UPI0011F9C377|nr:efflux RND transporter permease subunit [Phenylobacterium sp.]THD65283.1 MAG: efflux RND transporter permease subunit [Phenylobacterium sp.]
MISAVVRWALRHPRVVIAAGALLLVYGAFAAAGLKQGLLPPLAPASASVETEAPGLGTEQVEQLVTRAVESALIGSPGVANLHSTSIPGRSIVSLEFQAHAEPLKVRQAIAERLSQAVAVLPQGIGAPRLAPSTSGGGDLLKIAFTSRRLSPMDLRTLVQWTVRPALLSSPGVADVEVYGGEVRRIEVRARAGDLSDSDLGYADVYEAVRRATGVTGAGFIDTPTQRVLVDPHGQALSADDVAAGQIQVTGSAPTRISDVADVVDAPTPPVGDALVQGRPAVLLRISAQTGANTLDATRAVESKLAVLRPLLAAQDVQTDTSIDRPADFVTTSLSDLVRDLAIGVSLVALLMILALRDWRGALVGLLTLPLAFAAALIVLSLLGWTLNLMTLGGLIVALGLVVDEAVIDLDHLLTRLRDAEFRGGSRPDAVLRASIEVRQPVVYATVPIVVGLTPVFFIPGIGGALLAPFAAALIIALLASLAVSVLVTPALALLFLGHIGPDREPPVLHRLKTAYDGGLAQVMAIRPLWIWLASLALILISGLAFAGFRSEFLPSVHSRHLTAELSGPASTSISAMQDFGRRLTRDLLAIPQVATVSQQTGRAETGVETSGPEHALFDIKLRRGLSDRDQDAIQQKISAIVERYEGFHGVVRSRFASEIAGPERHGEVEVRIAGDDLDALDTAASRVAAALIGLPGANRITPTAAAVAPSVRVDLNFQRLAIYGLSAADVLDTLQTAFEGRRAAQVYDRGRAVDIVVTAQAGLRQDPEGAGDLLLRSSSGVSAPLKTVANVYLSGTRGAIQHDNGVRSVSVVADGVGDPPAFIREARDRIARSVVLPAGVYVDFVSVNSGGFGGVGVLVALVLAALGILGFICLAFGSARAAVLIIGSAAFAFIGGVAAVAVTGGILSLGALAGFVVLFGVSARAAVLLISQVEELVHVRGRPWASETVRLAARQRLWPIVIGAVLVSAAVSPMAFHAGRPGMEILGPMAWVIIGGLASSTLLGLSLLPPMALAIWRPRRKPDAADAGPVQV